MSSEKDEIVVHLTTEECPGCRKEVERMVFPPCSHPRCPSCMPPFPSPCPTCDSSLPSNNPCLPCVQLQCGLCNQLKASEEFFWCTECSKMICCRCLAKLHGTKHTLTEWNSGLVVSRALVGLFGENTELDLKGRQQKLRESVEELLQPIVDILCEKFARSRIETDRENFVESVCSSFGIQRSALETARTNSNPNPQLVAAVGKLAGLNWRNWPNLSEEYSMPSSLKEPQIISEMILKSIIINKFDLPETKSIVSSENSSIDSTGSIELTQSSEASTPVKRTENLIPQQDSGINTKPGSSAECQSTKGVISTPFEVERIVFGQEKWIAVLMRQYIMIFEMEIDGNLKELRYLRPKQLSHSFWDIAVWEKTEDLFVLTANEDAKCWVMQASLTKEGIRFNSEIHLGEKLFASEGIKAMSGSICVTHRGDPYVIINDSNGFATLLKLNFQDKPTESGANKICRSVVDVYFVIDKIKKIVALTPKGNDHLDVIFALSNDGGMYIFSHDATTSTGGVSAKHDSNHELGGIIDFDAFDSDVIALHRNTFSECRCASLGGSTFKLEHVANFSRTVSFRYDFLGILMKRIVCVARNEQQLFFSVLGADNCFGS